MHDTDVAGKTVVITGASRGVGEHLAGRFAAAGARVVLNYHRHAKPARDAAAEICRRGGAAIALGADVSENKAVKTMLDDTLEAYGTVDILVNNAGINIDKPFLELAEADWARVMDVNLKGAFLCTQTFGRVMVTQGSGKIINISAVTGVQGRPNAANYCVSKAGLNMLTKCAALELAPAVQVNGIALGFFDSELVREMWTQAQLDAVAQSTAVRRLGKLEDVARAALFLSGSGSDFMSGQTIVLDGGKLML